MYEINQILKQLGMTIKEFSDQYEIPYNTIRQWTQGTRKPPSYVIKLLNEKIKRDSKGIQLKIEQEIEYECYCILQDGKTGIFRTHTKTGRDTWIRNVKGKKTAWVEEKITINKYDIK